MDKNEMYDILIECGVDEEFISGAICCGGFNKGTMERILFYKFGLRSFEQLFEDEEEEEEA